MDRSKDKNFCVMPFTHMEIAPRGNTLPCCAFKSQELFKKEDAFTVPSPNVNKIGLTTIFEKHAYWVKSRNLALKNEINPACVQCHMEEESGSRSYRQRMNKKYLPYIDIEKEKKKLLTLELKLGAKCNIACRMCSSQHSNKLLKEDSIVAFGEVNKDWIRDMQSKSDWATTDVFWNQIYDISHELVSVKFTGGEPLIIQEHFKYLKWMSDNSIDPIINYITNGTVKLTDDIKDIWKKFHHVHMSLSIDAVGDLEEYIRTGTVWEEKKKNINDYIEFLGKDEVSFTVTVNSLNVDSILNLIDWLVNDMETDNVVFNILMHPAKFNLRNLPDNAKEHINYKLNNIINTNSKYSDNIINGLKNIQSSMNRSREDDVDVAKEILKQEAVYKLANKKEISFEKIEPFWFNILKR